jgi:branched-chain amino acid aminotransferase
MSTGEPLAYLDGRFLPQPQAVLAISDAGFAYGATATDFLRTFRQRPFRLREHLERFLRDCSALFVPVAESLDRLAEVAESLVAQNAALLPPGGELALVAFATPGQIPYLLGEPGGAGDAPPTLGMHTFPLSFARYRRYFTEGVRLVVPGAVAVGPDLLVDPRVKHRSRLHWWLADRLVRDPARFPPGCLAIPTDARTGSLTETAVGTFLAVFDGMVVVPPRETILDGVSLRVVEELCRDERISFAERPIVLADVPRMQEALLCGSAFCVAGVCEIAGRPVPWPGPVLDRLLAAWSDRVGLDVRGQMLAGA